MRWRFNAWGWPGHPPVQQDVAAGDAVAAAAGAATFASRLVNEGGAICVDGEGTVLATESVQLHDRRNPGWSKDDVERELCSMLGCRKVVWLATGLTGDMQGHGTHGHVDLLAAFVAPGLVVVHRQPDPEHPDHAVMAENVGRLRGATDARGRRLELVELDAPVNRWEDGRAPRLQLRELLVRQRRGRAVRLRRPGGRRRRRPRPSPGCYPAGQLVAVAALDLFRYGGGVHCITQQQPAPPAPRPT